MRSIASQYNQYKKNPDKWGFSTLMNLRTSKEEEISQIHKAVEGQSLQILEREIKRFIAEYEVRLNYAISELLHQKSVILKGDKGDSVDEESVISKLLSKMPKPKDGMSQKLPNINKMVTDEVVGYFIKNPIKQFGESDIEGIVKKFQPKIDYEELADMIARAMEKLPYEKKLDYDTGLKNKPGFSKEKKTSGARMGRGTGNATKYYDLSSQLNGVLKTFSIPSNLRVLDVRSSSAPLAFRQTVDYTYTSTSITFTDEILASSTLASGQTLYIIYVEA